MEHGVFDWDGCKRLVHAAVGIMQRNQASGWGDEISAGWRDVRAAMNGVSTWDEGAATVFCKAMRFMLDAVNRLRIDTANARLRLMTPMICSHGLEYERGHFRMKLAGGLLTLERATVRFVFREGSAGICAFCLSLGFEHIFLLEYAISRDFLVTCLLFAFEERRRRGSVRR